MAKKSSGAPGEAKGEEERLSLASQLKSLSAVMSAERASQQDGQQGQQQQQKLAQGSGASSGTKNDGSLAALLHQARVAIERLLEEDQLTYAYGVQQALRDLETKLRALETSGAQRITERDLSFLREGGRKLAGEASARSGIPRAVHTRLFALHRLLLGAHEAGLERVVVPRMAFELRNIVMQSPSLARKLGADAERMLELPPPKMIHEIAGLSLHLADADSDDPQVLAARSYVGGFAGIADELLAAKSLLRVCLSMAEMDHLIEGRKLSKKVFTAHQAATQLWPESLIHHAKGKGNGKEGSIHSRRNSSDAVSRAPVHEIVDLHLAIRQEQLRRARASGASIHEVAAWGHLVNACDELASLAFRAPGELQFGSPARSFVVLLRDLVEELSARASGWGRADSHAGDAFRASSLMMESTLTSQTTKLAPHSSNIRLLTQAAKDVRTARAVQLHVARLVENIMPGALTAVSVGSSVVDGITVTTASEVSEIDVAVCFTLGAEDAPSQQVTFARVDVSPHTQSAVFKALEHLELTDCMVDLDAVSETSTEDDQEMVLQKRVVDSIGALRCYAITSIPERLSRAVNDSSFKTADAQAFLAKELTAETGKTASLLVDPLTLRARPTDQLMRFFEPASSPMQTAVCALTPDVLVVLAETTRSAEVAAQKLS
ncbi:Hypothetical Protein FCC1311_049322 [Hondaea fermentalgiana]|uniref:Uncharacterized protein n=1 Tax=Hondaea fermentalgiana TaxID=2315210 RepID=A0A2R5GKA2_9STRA|nr:Hypothetical Protein FCC1311_049322 [Hondaea fermentalgiana]|eukprot:GBG28711.1 Hypothetical Protein FCC1311_049322 [Hondaea fermentalgiana]